MNGQRVIRPKYTEEKHRTATCDPRERQWLAGGQFPIALRILQSGGRRMLKKEFIRDGTRRITPLPGEEPAGAPLEVLAAGT